MDKRRRHSIILDFIVHTKRPVYYIEPLDHPFATEHFGLYLKVDKETPASVLKFTGRQPILDYLQRVAETGHRATSETARSEASNHLKQAIIWVTSFRTAPILLDRLFFVRYSTVDRTSAMWTPQR